MRSATLLGAVALLVTLLPQTAEAMYCGNRLVSTGDSSARVRAICGEPFDVVDRTATRTRAVARRLPDGHIIYDTITITVHIVQWTYNFGPTRFMRQLTFEEGRLVRLETLGYGTDPPSSP